MDFRRAPTASHRPAARCQISAGVLVLVVAMILFHDPNHKLGITRVRAMDILGNGVRALALEGQDCQALALKGQDR